MLGIVNHLNYQGIYFNTLLKYSYVSQWGPICSLQINWFRKYFLKTKICNFFFFGTLLLRHNSTTTTTKQQQYFGDAHTNAHICGVFLGLMCVCAYHRFLYWPPPPTSSMIIPQQRPQISLYYSFSDLYLLSLSVVSVHNWMDIYHKSSAATLTNHSSVWIAQILEDIKKYSSSSISGASFYALTG